jgi:hypothetical protein
VRCAAVASFFVVLLGAPFAHAQLIPRGPPPDGPDRAGDVVGASDFDVLPWQAPADVPRFVAGAGGHVAFGSAPAVSLGVRVSAEAATTRWSLALEGRYDLPASALAIQDATARTSLVGGALVPCLRTRSTWGCAVVLLSRIEGDAARPGEPRVSDAAFFLGLGARIAAHVGLPHQFAIRFTAEVLLHPFAFELTRNGQALYRSSPASMTLGPTLVRAF